MERIDANQLRKTIPTEEFDYTFLTSALSEYSGVRQKINRLLRDGVITRVKKGLYVFGTQYNREPVCKEALANLIYGPSYISLEYALGYYGLIPERVELVTSVTPKRDKKFKTPLGYFDYKYQGLDKYSVGIEQVWADSKHPVLMASPEKALCDYVTLRKVPQLKKENEAKDFLESDLRIDRSLWNKFKIDSLRKLNKVYRNKNIDRIMDALEAEGSRS